MQSGPERPIPAARLDFVEALVADLRAVTPAPALSAFIGALLERKPQARRSRRQRSAPRLPSFALPLCGFEPNEAFIAGPSE